MKGKHLVGIALILIVVILFFAARSKNGNATELRAFQ